MPAASKLSCIWRKLKWVVLAGAVGTGALLVDARFSRPKFKKQQIPFVHPEPPTREENLEKMKKSSMTSPFDVLVIGGGATGSGVALDATLRGYNVALCESNDYASETSCRSTKLIHGGVRYLEKAVLKFDWDQLMLVFEALGERATMINQAPHLCAPLPTLIPCYSVLDVGKFWAGMKLYDLLAAFGRGTLSLSSYHTPMSTLGIFPRLIPQKDPYHQLTGSVVYYDGQFDDARMCSTVALTASCYGAAIGNHCEVTHLLNTKSEKGEKRVIATVKDTISNSLFEVVAKSVVNSTGPFSDDIRKMVDPHKEPSVVPSSGTHITLPAEYSPKGTGVIIPSPDGRVVFVLPWLGKTIAGTTDNPCKPHHEPRATEADVQFILRSIAQYCGEVPRSAVTSAWCGIRPLAGSPNTKGTQNIVREHVVEVDKEHCLVNISGGKWTTYRRMAADVVDAVTRSFFGKDKRIMSSQTANLRLLGARSDLEETKKYLQDKIELKEVRQHLLSYGDQAKKVLDVCASVENGMRPLSPSLPVLQGEIVYAMRHEHAETISDFVSRRTRMSFFDAAATEKVLELVGATMAKEGKWSGSRLSAAMAEAKNHMKSFFPCGEK